MGREYIEAIVRNIPLDVETIFVPSPSIVSFIGLCFLRVKVGRAQWFTPVIPALWEGGRGGWITKSRDRDHPGQHGETRLY